MCGCGDDLTATIERRRKLASSINTNDSGADLNDARPKYLGMNKLFHNFTYQRRGDYKYLVY